MGSKIGRLVELSEIAEVSEEVALELASELALSGFYDESKRICELDAFADSIIGRRAFQEDEVATNDDLATLAEDAGF
ncbi:hypothetical protein [Sphingomonas sp. 3-13AW]|uniref:hypothetical protein n=1 Tax=Sphingomonas sp. 3-13AW TaxID=3050450 RepID=UPI003BB518A5